MGIPAPLFRAARAKNAVVDVAQVLECLLLGVSVLVQRIVTEPATQAEGALLVRLFVKACSFVEE